MCKFLKVSLISLLIISLGACSSKEIAPSREAEHNTTVWLLSKFGEVDNSYSSELKERILTRLNTGVKVLYPEKEKPLRIFILESDMPSAFSQCDGTIFITAGLIKRVGSLGELTSVIAHEIAHVYRADACHIDSDQDGMVSYSNPIEIETDKLSVKFLMASFIDPRYLLTALQNQYRIFSGDEAEKVSLNARISALQKGISDIPAIRTKFVEERLFTKFRSNLD